MRRLRGALSIVVAGALVAGLAAADEAAATAAEPPSAADVLAKLHRANEREIAMGQMALERGHARGVKSFGRTLVKDHTAADKEVQAVAREEGVDLAATTPAATDADTLPTGEAFDGAFAKMMLEDHQRTITELTDVRASTSNARLKRLVTELLPTLRKHADTAARLVDEARRS